MTVAAFNLQPVQLASIVDQAGVPAPDGVNGVEFCDDRSDDYPALRLALTTAGASYDFYSQRADEGDHTVWRHGRGGKDEEFSNFGNSETPIKPLRDCAF